jgi:membrane protein
MADGWPARLRSRGRAWWAATKHRRQWLAHVVAAWDRLQRNNGNLYAGAITYFSFLALFPLLLLGVGVTGFVLHSDPALQANLFRHVSDQVPGRFGSTLRSSLHAAIDNRSGVGVIGLAGVLLTGLGWIGNLRAAIDAVWGRPPAKRSFVTARLSNLLVLVGLGVGVVVSISLTVVGTSLTDQILTALSLDDLPGATLVLKLLGIALAVAGDTIICWWLLVRLPAVEVPERIAWRGALLAAAGFEVLKIAGTYTVAHTAQSPTAGPFAGIIAVLIWIQLVARWVLFACSWTATLTVEAAQAGANRRPVVAPGPQADPPPADEVSPVVVGVALVGAGAVAGAAATWAVIRPGPRRQRRRARRQV